jgi:hypothetical protein
MKEQEAGYGTIPLPQKYILCRISDPDERFWCSADLAGPELSNLNLSLAGYQVEGLEPILWVWRRVGSDRM